MPQTSVRPTRSDGEFAELFARKARTPLRGFLPGRRVWKAVGGSTATVLVIIGASALVSRIDWRGDPETVTTLAEKKAAAEDRGEPSPTASSSGASSSGASAKEKADEEKADKAPDGVRLPGSGGSGGGTSGGGSGSSGSGTSGDEDTSRGEDQGSSPQPANSSEKVSTSYLWSDGSADSTEDNAYWDMSVVTVKSTKPLSGLKVVVKIIQTGGVVDTGVWCSLGDKVSVASAASSGEQDYVVTLKPGVTLDPGTYVFQFGYNHAQGDRTAGGDRYNVTATSTSSVEEFRKGGF